MFSPEEQQIEICLLKSNLEKIGDDLLVQNSAMPALDAENEQKYRETMSALRVARSLNAERERLNLENVKLTAKRMQLKRQCDDITKTLERARANRDDLAGSLKREEQEMELLIRKYEDSLREKAERFRKTSSFYNEDEMKAELEKANNSIKDLEDEMMNHQNIVDELKRTLDELQAEVPENLLAIL
ncbi:protein Daple-like [Ostrinia nubilalis]|uniref:protein Daple-like n=1 Tax=Ostrinia nubilalis TaxID=29057 RepID=UPI00308236A0